MPTSAFHLNVSIPPRASPRLHVVASQAAAAADDLADAEPGIDLRAECHVGRQLQAGWEDSAMTVKPSTAS